MLSGMIPKIFKNWHWKIQYYVNTGHKIRANIHASVGVVGNEELLGNDAGEKRWGRRDPTYHSSVVGSRWHERCLGRKAQKSGRGSILHSSDFRVR